MTNAAKLLETYCKETGTSKRSLSLKIGRGEKFVADIVAGKNKGPDPDALRALADVTGISYDALTADLRESAHKPTTLQDALDAIAKSRLAQSTKDELRRDVTRFCDRLLKAPSAVPADKRSLRRHLAGKTAREQGFSTDKRFKNFKRNIERALEMANSQGLKKYAAHLSPEWKALLDCFERSYDRAPLTAFFRYADSQGLLPVDVTDETVAAFHAHRLENGSVASTERQIRKKVAELIRTWNHAAQRFHNQSWPQITLTPLPDRRRIFSATHDDFPELLEEFERYAAWASGFTDKNGDTYVQAASKYDDASYQKGFRSAPLSERTLDRIRESLVLAAKSLADTGTPTTEITCIADCVTPDAVTFTLQESESRQRARHDETGYDAEAESTYARTIAKDLKELAINWCGITGEDAELLTRRVRQSTLYVKRGEIMVQRRGMTDKNRKRLEPFKDDHVVRDLLRLPADLIFSAEKQRKKTRTVTEDMARAVQDAIALTLLRVSPVRRSNLFSPKLGTNIIAPLKSNSTGKLYYAEGEIKNSVEISREISPERWRAIKLYLTHYRPVLMVYGDETNPYLFPSPEIAGRAFTAGAMADRLTDRIREDVGVRMNMQLFRHLVGTLALKHDANSLYAVSKALGHRSLATTREYYAELDADVACNKVDDVLSGYEDGPRRRRSQRRHV